MMNVFYAIFCGLQLLCFIKAVLGFIALILATYLKEDETIKTAIWSILVGTIRTVVLTVILIVL